MWDRKLPSLRALEAEANSYIPAISCNPGTMTDPLPAVERVMNVFRRRVKGNPLLAYEKSRPILGELREIAAETFGGSPRGWAFAEGLTTTVDRVANSLIELLWTGEPIPVVTTDHEHVGGVGAFLADSRFCVVQVEPESLYEIPGKLYFLSQVTYDTNQDLSGIIRSLVQREDRPIVIVDGNQAIGQIDVDVASLGCDVYLTSAHKWLGGPPGTGLLYLREDVLRTWPCPLHAGEPLCKDLPVGKWEPRGGQDFARIAGVAAAVRAYQCHGKNGRECCDAFVAEVTLSLGDQVIFLEEATTKGRAVVLEVPGIDVYPIYRELNENGVSVKCIKKPRLSVAGGRESLEVLRIGFPWWVSSSERKEAARLFVHAVQDITTTSPSLMGVAPLATP